jgi:hypothetical protein
MQDRFRITPVIGGQPYRLDVERTLQPNGMELFRVIGRNKTITIRTNRLILEQKGLKHRTGTWLLVQGQSNNPGKSERIVETIIEALKKQVLSTS